MIGRGGTGRDRGGKERGEEWGWWEGRGGEGRSIWAPPPPLETSSGSAPEQTINCNNAA